MTLLKSQLRSSTVVSCSSCSGGSRIFERGTAGVERRIRARIEAPHGADGTF